MKRIMDALTEFATVAIVMLTQSVMIGALVLLVALVAYPDAPAAQRVMQWIKGVL